MQIRFLADVPGHARTLATWHHAQWGHLYSDWTREVALAELEDHATRRGLPTTLVALEGDALLGSASLVDEDAPELRDRGNAWLASLYVIPAARGRGLGQQLVRAVVSLARQQGLGRLWLFTPEHAAFYAGLGWSECGRAQLRGIEVTLMQIEPA